MSDLVERLRRAPASWPVCHEAAAEIERLRVESAASLRGWHRDIERHEHEVMEVKKQAAAEIERLRADNEKLAKIGVALNRASDKLTRELANREDRLAMLSQSLESAKVEVERLQGGELVLRTELGEVEAEKIELAKQLGRVVDLAAKEVLRANEAAVEVERLTGLLASWHHAI